MPEVVTCPKCQRKSRVPDNLVGKKVKCPGCGDVFVAVSSAPPPPPPPKKEDEEDEGGTYDVADGKSRRRKNRREHDDDEGVSDKPRGRRAKDDDDDEDKDKPRTSRTRGRDDDDDDDDDRVSRRRRSSRDDDDDDDDDDRPRRRGRRRSSRDDDDDDDIDDGGRADERADWPRVYRGLTMILASSIISVLLPIVLIVGILLIFGAAITSLFNAAPAAGGAGGGPGAAGGAAAAGTGIIILGLLAVVGFLGAAVLKILGHIFCLTSPPAQGAMGLALATLILVLTNWGCTLLQYIIMIAQLGSLAFKNIANPVAAGQASSGVVQALGWIGGLAGLASFFVFMFYLRSLALVNRQSGLASSIVFYMISTVVLPIVGCVGGCIAFMVVVGAAANANAKNQNANPAAVVGSMGAMGFVCLGVFVIGWLAMIVWYLMIIVQARAGVGGRLRA